MTGQYGSGSVVFAYLTPDQLAAGETGDGSPPVTGGVTDSFTRTVADGWGTSDFGTVWLQGGLGESAVNGTEGTLTVDMGAFEGSVTETLEFTNLLPLDVTITARMSHSLKAGDPNLGSDGEYLVFNIGDFYVEISAGFIYVQGPSSPFEEQVSLAITETQNFKVRATMEASGSPLSIYVWEASVAQPGSPNMTFTGTDFSAFESYTVQLVQLGTDTIPGALTGFFDDLKILGLGGTGDPPVPAPDNPATQAPIVYGSGGPGP